MKKVIPFTIVLVFAMGLLLIPPVGEMTMIRQDLREESSATLSEGVARNIRVAIYDESDTSPTSYCACPHLTNDIQPTVDLLTSAGYDVTLLVTADILDHELLTANYDVFVLVNNVPRDLIYDYVLEFWLGGGGIMSFNGGFGYLMHSGIFTPDYAGVDAYLGEWLYVCDVTVPYINYTILNRHPTAKDYHVGDVVPSYINDSVIWNPAFATYSNAYEFTSIAGPVGGEVLGFMVAVEPDGRAGGRVMQIPCNGSYIEPGMQSIIIDSVNWLTPRPKARIVYDLSHHPRLGVDAWDTMCYFPEFMTDMRDLLEMSGYTVDKLYEDGADDITSSRLAPYDMLILLSPDRNYTAPEITAVQSWVSDGGGLLCMGESPLYVSFEQPADQINWLMESFDMELGPYNYVTFVTGSLAEHPLAEGVASAPYSAVGFVNYSGDAFRLTYENGNAYSAAQDYGLGRAILFADMNFASNDELGDSYNTQFVRNIANWLTATRARVLYFSNEPYATYGLSPGGLALNDLGIDYFMNTHNAALNMSLYMYDWDLVIIDAPWYQINSYLDDINNYLDTGGKLLMSYYWATPASSHPLWSRIGFEVIDGIGDPQPTYIWQSSHGIFNIPNDYSAANFTPTLDYGTEGDYLNVFSNATVIAGQTPTEQPGNATIVLGLSGQVLYNGFLIDEYQGDYDDSTYMDSFELWENEIAFMLRPTINHPSDVEYLEGTTGNSITWSPSSDRPLRYSITLDAAPESSGSWTGGHVNINVDGLNNGTHEYKITVYDTAGYSVSDIVDVNVTVESTTTTNTTGGVGNLTTLIIIIVAGAIVIIIVIVVLMKKKK